MTALQTLITIVQGIYELRIVINDHQTEIQLWTYPSPSDRSQQQTGTVHRATPEQAAQAVINALNALNTYSQPIPPPTHTETNLTPGADSPPPDGSP